MLQHLEDDLGRVLKLIQTLILLYERSRVVAGFKTEPSEYLSSIINPV